MIFYIIQQIIVLLGTKSFAMDSKIRDYFWMGRDRSPNAQKSFFTNTRLKLWKGRQSKISERQPSKDLR